MKSRQIFNVELFENILMTISRFDSEKNALLAFEDYYGWNKDGDVIATDKFFLRFALTCYANGLIETARHVEKILIADDVAKKDDFQSGHVCAAIQQSQTTSVKDFTLKMKPCREELAKFHDNIRYHAIENINLVIRSLAKFRMTEEIFDLFDCLRANRVKVLHGFVALVYCFSNSQFTFIADKFGIFRIPGQCYRCHYRCWREGGHYERPSQIFFEDTRGTI